MAGYVIASPALQDEIERRIYSPTDGYTSIKSLYDYFRRLPQASLAAIGGQRPTYAQIKAVFRAQQNNAELKPNSVHRAEYNSIVGKYAGNSISVDLAEFTNPAQQRWNNESGLRANGRARSYAIGGPNTFKYLFVAICNYSARAWGIPMKNKREGSIINALNTIQDDILNDPVPLDPRGEQRLDSHLQGQAKRIDNITSDGESGIANSVRTRRWLRDRNIRLWVSPTNTLGKGRVYKAERLIRTIREMLRRRWALTDPPNFVWATPRPPAGQPDTTSVIAQIIDEYNNRHFHRGIKNRPMEVWNGAMPEWKRIALEHGECTQGRRCTTTQRRGVRVRDTSNLFTSGDVVKVVQVVRGVFEKKTDALRWSQDNFIILAQDSPTGRENYIMGFNILPQEQLIGAGPRLRPEQKIGLGQRFLIQNLNNPQDIRSAMHYALQKINPKTTRVYNPDAAASGGRPTIALSERPIKPTQGKTLAEQKREASALRRLAQQEGITQANVVKTVRRVRRSSRVPEVVPVKSAAKSRTGKIKKVFRVGNRVTVYYPTLKQTFTGTVIEADRNRLITVEFNPSPGYPDGSIATVKPPYSFVKKL